MQVENEFVKKTQVKCVSTTINSFNSFPNGGTNQRPLVLSIYIDNTIVYAINVILKLNSAQRYFNTIRLH